MFFLAEESDTYQSVQEGAQRRAQKVETHYRLTRPKDMLRTRPSN